MGHTSGSSKTTCLAGVGFPCPAVGVPFAGSTASHSNSVSGWTAGAGIEWRFLQISSNNRVDLVRVGVNYLFNFGRLER